MKEFITHRQSDKLHMLSLKYAVYENIHWGGFAFIKNVSKGRKKSLQWG
jgi:hypothetical protein